MYIKFEDLPNELILEIFQYTKIRDLSCGFWNLTKRFNQLLSSLKHLSTVLTKSYSFESLLFSQQIARLVIVTLDKINLDSFVNLRSLTLNWANEDHLQQIRSNQLPNLVYLSLPATFNEQSTKQLASEIFSNKFSQLRYADLGLIGKPDQCSWSQSLSLRSLHIVCSDINLIPIILQSCPQLKHFQVRILVENDLNTSSLPILSNHPLNQLIFIQTASSKFVYNIDYIFGLLPNITRIDLRLCTRSFITLIRSIPKYFIYLKHFDCHIIEYPIENELININQIRNIHLAYRNIDFTLREDKCCLYSTRKQ